MVTFDEKRASRRVSVLLPVQYQMGRRRGEGSRMIGKATDVSANGLRLKVQGRTVPKEGDLLYIQLDTVSPGGFIQVQGRVAWIEEDPGDRSWWEIGVRLTGMELDQWDPWLELLSWHGENAT